MEKAAEFVIKKRQMLVRSLDTNPYPHTRGPESSESSNKNEPSLSQYIFDRMVIKGDTAVIPYHFNEDYQRGVQGAFTVIKEDGVWPIDYP